ncbi:hypothetical protein AURDEDRAFT_165642 [Auricularia subglabra TFB-10046 SS5]|nr:hypothetical protein AURDEDRAFT_165642 [Auricularia subglabra TFB-10046 SS5]
MGGDIVVEDDDDAYVHYFPESAWSSYNNMNSAYHGHSYHSTRVGGAYVTFNFTGSYIAYYSDSNSDHGAFYVSVDGGPEVELSTYGTELEEKIMFFSKIMGVDYFVCVDSPFSVLR